jgi:hypothetical protein
VFGVFLRYWVTNRNSTDDLFIANVRVVHGNCRYTKWCPEYLHRRQGISYINYRLQQIDQQKRNFFKARPAAVWLQTADVTGIQLSMVKWWNGYGCERG